MGKLVAENIKQALSNPNPTITKSLLVFSIIELCGSLLTGNTGQGTTKKNLEAFLKSDYFDNKYSLSAKLLVDIYRNGVAHSYVPKGGAYITNNPEHKSLHLQYFDEGMVIHIDTFINDLVVAIDKYLLALNNSDLLKKYYIETFIKIKSEGLTAYKSFLKENKISPEHLRMKSDILPDV